VTALWQALLSWRRWHSPRRASARMDLIEADVLQLQRQMNAQLAALAEAYRIAGINMPEISGQPEPADCPERAPVRQRDLDDAVAELIRDARRDFGRGGAR
jgi:hypothetical protein